MGVRLVMFNEQGRRRDFLLKDGATTIGRKTDCDIRIPVGEVSRLHAEVLADEDGATVRDLGASNGTYVNNQRITDEDLEPGDHLMIGPVVFVVQIDGEPGDDELLEIRSEIKTKQAAGGGGASVGTSEHVYSSDEEVDPIAALEALASSADQTAIEPEEEKGKRQP